METFYEVIRVIELVPASQAGVGPNQPAGTSKESKSGRIPDWENTLIPKYTRLSQARKKSTKRSA